ncbi:hypothetical protein SNE40_010647 [Patella caerulea]|uniref:Lipocalin/cytosolic fatty-acid binding domain-containing protein n=1 Tax=Patella caerulea TaxID=87958 RepID=A0AAN8PT23_PATCE
MEGKCLLQSLIFVILIQLAVSVTDPVNCQVNTFQTKQNFDLKKYLGVWYEMKWIIPFSVPVADRYLDYQHKYSMNTDDQVLVSITARNSSKHCLYITAYVNLTETPGKMVISNQPNGGGDTYTYWIIETDYNNYAVVYGCGQTLSNGTCGATRLWIWSRKTSITPTLLSQAEMLLNRLCLDTSSLITTSHDEGECPQQSDDAMAMASSNLSVIIPTIVYLYMFYLT